MAKITLKDLSHSYLTKQSNDADWALRGVDIDWKDGGAYALLGPSGCGKTTLLNAIAGFHSVTEGEIYLDNEILCGPNKPLADQGSDRIVVFQHGALFPWKTLQENVVWQSISCSPSCSQRKIKETSFMGTVEACGA